MIFERTVWIQWVVITTFSCSNEEIWRATYCCFLSLLSFSCLLLPHLLFLLILSFFLFTSSSSFFPHLISFFFHLCQFLFFSILIFNHLLHSLFFFSFPTWSKFLFFISSSIVIHVGKIFLTCHPSLPLLFFSFLFCCILFSSNLSFSLLSSLYYHLLFLFFSPHFSLLFSSLLSSIVLFSLFYSL